MKICQVISSNIPIKPTGQRQWGAVELIIDEYAKNLRRLGHQVDVKYLNEIQPNEYDIVHIHVANLCIEAANRGLKYIYSTHDHHSYHYGKNSWNYKQQLEAIKGSVFSLAPAEYVVDYFDDTDKLFFLTHGVDTSYYLPNYSINTNEHKLLIVANNGVAGDYGADRKGFRFGIEAAKELDLPITIVGAEANTKFFEIHKDLLEYSKLNVIDTNITEDEKLKIFQEHTIFVHPSNLEYGCPNLSILEAASCSLPIVGTLKGKNHFWGMWIIPEITTQAVVIGINETIKTYDKRRDEMFKARESYDWIYVLEHLAENYEASLQVENFSSDIIKEKYINVFNNTVKL